MNAIQAKDLVSRWLDAANSHNIDKIMAFYADDAELESPVVVETLKVASGRIRGEAALRAYFSQGLGSYRLHLVDVAVGVSSISAWYVNQKGSRTSAYLEIDASGKIARNVTHYSD
jgi:ketosteroid isomerase-like protein